MATKVGFLSVGEDQFPVPEGRFFVAIPGYLTYLFHKDREPLNFETATSAKIFKRWTSFPSRRSTLFGLELPNPHQKYIERSTTNIRTRDLNSRAIITEGTPCKVLAFEGGAKFGQKARKP